MMIIGLDISHHQGEQPDLARAARDGIQFVIIKATEGSTFVDPRFGANLAEARAAGLLVAAYHYVKDGVPAQAQVANVRRAVPLDVPVIPDIENGSGPVPPIKTLVGLLQMAGYGVPLTYLPRWYWQQLGSPDLRGLPPLWSSRYPDNVVGTIADELADVPATYWNGYGGLDVAVLQFTSSARVAGYAPLDANAYRGTRDQLAALFGQEEDDPVKNLILAREKGNEAVWVGDGINRRHVADLVELAGLRFWIGQKGGDNTVYDFEDIRVLGVDLAEAPPPVPVEIDYERVIAGLAAKLALGFEPIKPPATP
jgi:hypothetical protein